MPTGQRFSITYLNRNEPTKDSERFRRRLSAYCTKYVLQGTTLRRDAAGYLEEEAGIDVPFIRNYGSSFSLLFRDNQLKDILDSITLIYSFLGQVGLRGSQAKWKDFVGRALREENIGYQTDVECGIHYFVDEEFERNRFSTLAGLNSPQHSGIKAAHEDAYRHMDSTPPDTKAAARSIFEAIEILAKQLTGSKNLNIWLLENTLKDLALKTLANDETEKAVIAEMFSGMGKWVNGMHNYRHGQTDADPTAPSEELIVYILSSGSSFLRLLLEIWKKSPQPDSE